MHDGAGGGKPAGRRLDEIGDLSERVLRSFDKTEDERLRQLLSSLVVHLHSFVADVGLTKDEWRRAVDFLTAVGQKCDAERQEFVLLSDVLGLSMLVELVNDIGSPDGERALPPTLPTVLGPFHMTASPVRRNGDTISDLGDGTPLLVQVTVRAEDGARLGGATVDVWQCNADGYYDVQQPGVQVAGNGRGLFTADPDGRMECLTVIPSHYPIPTDGPVGTLLRATGRQPWRPAHIHFIAEAEGHLGLTTHVFMPGSPHLDSDAVFAVRPSLVCHLTEEHDSELVWRYGVPLIRTEVELVLRKAPSAGAATDPQTML